MSHRSRVCAVLFDTESAAYSATVAFWAGALGRAVPTKQRDRYTTLTGPLDYTVQSVEPADHGVHIDLETDDVDAEVARLAALGARRKYQVKSWWVMEDPGGHPFCVVPVQSNTWPEGAVTWPSG